MALRNPSVGEMYAPAYQIAGIPFVTSSIVTLGQTKMVTFEQVSKFFTVKNNGPAAATLAVGFTENGLKSNNSNYFILSGSESLTAEIKTDRLFISGSSGTSPFSIIAGLTYIASKDMLPVTGSNGFNGVG